MPNRTTNLIALLAAAVAVGGALLPTSALAVNCATLADWSADEVYLQGDRVRQWDVAFEAKWWTRNQRPSDFSGQWQVWQQVGRCDEAGGNTAPTALANGPYAGEPGTEIAFSSAGSADAEGPIADYRWQFGDGSSSNEPNPTHAYQQSGTYEVALAVTDGDGLQATATTVAEISASGDLCAAPGWRSDAVYLGGDRVRYDGQAYEANWWTRGQAPDQHSGAWDVWTLLTACGLQNQPPVAEINGPDSGAPGESLGFSGSGSNDPDGDPLTYSWQFGDASESSLANPQHSYAAAGRYSVTLTVTDPTGAEDTATTSVRIGEPGDGEHGRRVVGYFTEWGVYDRDYHVKDLVSSGAAARLTHIVYAFGNVREGRCTIGDSYAAYDRFYAADESVDGVADSWDADALRGNFGQLRRLKALYPDIEILWSFGGWTWSGGFGEAAAAPEAFADSCYELVFDPRWADVFDGIDIDWEYPNACGLTCDASGFAAYRDLMQALRARFGDEHRVTAAIGAGEAKLNAADYAGAAEYLDFYMLMSYDFFGAWDGDGPTAPHAPLFGYDGIPVAGFTIDQAVQRLASKGVPADKILLGIGFYGRGWSGVGQTAPGGSASGPAPGTYEAGVDDYKVLVQSCPATERIAGTAYGHCGDQWWSYDTPATIDGKMDYVAEQGLGGAFFWELSGDTADGELIEAIEAGLSVGDE
jgi:chitinase